MKIGKLLQLATPFRKYGHNSPLLGNLHKVELGQDVAPREVLTEVSYPNIFPIRLVQK